MATPIPDNAARFALDAVAAHTEGVVSRQGGAVSRVVTDSRRVRPGDLFVALVGETHDGHRFLSAVAEAGAAAVLVQRGAAVPEGPGVVEVADTTRALGDLARAHRAAFGGPVVGITGSAGKTTTKELVAAALAAGARRVHRTEGNLNNLVGVPMTLFALPLDADVAVVEMGTNQPGEIGRLAEIASPDVGLVTLVATAHTEGLGTLEAVAEEKGALFRALRPDGVAVVNADEPLVRGAAERTPARRRVRYGRSDDAHVQLVDVTLTADLRTRCTYEVVGFGELVVSMRLLGDAAALNTGAALGVAVALGRDLAEVAAALEEVAPHPGRFAPVAGPDDVLVLDDTYNANPRSTELALHTAARLAQARGTRLVAALGDMKELGAQSAREHRAVGRTLAEIGVGAVLLVGAEMALAGAEHGSADAVVVPDSHEAARAIQNMVRPGDVVLVKGSRSMQMERVVSALTTGGTAS